MSHCWISGLPNTQVTLLYVLQGVICLLQTVGFTSLSLSSLEAHCLRLQSGFHLLPPRRGRNDLLEVPFSPYPLQGLRSALTGQSHQIWEQDISILRVKMYMFFRFSSPFLLKVLLTSIPPNSENG